MKKFSRLILATALGTPFLAFAQSGINRSYITPYSDGIINIINGILVPVLIAIAFIVFLWGIFKYFIWGGENESEKAEGRKFAMWGVIGFVIILSLWGIVNLVMGTFGLSVGKAPPFPTIGGSAPSSNTSAPVFPGTGQTPVSPGTTPGYGSGTAACTPPQVQSPEGGCYTPIDTTPAQGSPDTTDEPTATPYEAEPDPVGEEI